MCCGSQDDSSFVEDVVEIGKFDVVVDGVIGLSCCLVKSLAKYVKGGGLYIVEDVHACYWQGFRGESGSLNALLYFLGLAHSLNS